MSEELQELKEHAEHAHDDPSLAPVSLTMAVLAVLVAVVSLLGHRAHTEEVVLQAKALTSGPTTRRRIFASIRTISSPISPPR